MTKEIRDETLPENYFILLVFGDAAGDFGESVRGMFHDGHRFFSRRDEDSGDAHLFVEKQERRGCLRLAPAVSGRYRVKPQLEDAVCQSTKRDNGCHRRSYCPVGYSGAGSRSTCTITIQK